MPIVAQTLKNTNNHVVIKMVGQGTHTITLNTLLTTVTKPASFVSGVNQIRVPDSIGIVVGGGVTGTGIAGGTTVTKIENDLITLSANTTAPASGSYVFQSQVAVAPKVDISALMYDAPGTGNGTITIARNSQTVLHLSRGGNLAFNGFSLSENNTHNIVVTFSGTHDSSMIIELRKVGGYGDSTMPTRLI